MMRGKRIAVLGHSGMLGSAASEFFGQTNDIFTVNLRLSQENAADFISKTLESQPDIIINALGMIKQKYPEDETMRFVNGVFPRILVDRMNDEQVLVQPSTDCVFSGKRGMYTLSDMPDTEDVYGKSKLESEIVSYAKNALVIRTSIIGLEKVTNHNLLSWFLSQDKSVRGYTNCHWSGITTITWCEAVDTLLLKNRRGMCQLATDRISKYELLLAARDVFNHNIEIEPTTAPMAIDRSLSGSSFSLPDIKTQMSQLKGRT